MNILGLLIPFWVFDWTGSFCVIISLIYLFRKSSTYWHWSNASLVPYFLLFMGGQDWMLAGLQVSYLIFGIHGLYLWFLENRRDRGEIKFNEPVWYAVTWVASIAIFVYTVIVTDFKANPWNWVPFVAVLFSLIANFGTTRKWTWSWGVWILANAAYAVHFWHSGTDYRAQFALQFVLAAMSVKGWMDWANDDKQLETRGANRVEAVS
jgi:nicotinamide mononucleotide transporter